MLFTSWTFLFVFLPVSVGAFYLLAKIGRDVAATWLLLASIYFYGLWNAAHVLLLLSSILINYQVGLVLVRGEDKLSAKVRKAALIFGVAVNLAGLFYCKYLLLFFSLLANITTVPDLSAYTLFPLGISFFTFTQISFLVDTYQGKAREYSLLHYGLFVTFYPHLLAGPVLHHSELMPQFKNASVYLFNRENMLVGGTIFTIGLFKKVVLADGIAPYVSPVFDSAAKGAALATSDAWTGTLAFSLQLYFDFSGYSDMAIGMSRLFGIILPLNFYSPYKADNMIEFWRRWHMTLSRFLRDYLYIPLGGSRTDTRLRHMGNLFATMTLCGLWHGADMTFLLWGGYHGLALVLVHSWKRFRQGVPALAPGQNPLWPRVVCCAYVPDMDLFAGHVQSRRDGCIESHAGIALRLWPACRIDLRGGLCVSVSGLHFSVLDIRAAVYGLGPA